MLCRILKVGQREYIETVKTKTFVVSVLVTPIIIGAIIFFTGRISKDEAGPRRPMKVEVMDSSDELTTEVKTLFDEYNTSHPEQQIQLQRLDVNEIDIERVTDQQKDKLRSGKLDMYIAVEKGVINGDGKVRIYTCKTKARHFDVPITVENLLNRAVFNQRCKLQNLSPQLLAELRRRIATEHIEVGSTAEEERVKDKTESIVEMMVPFFFMYLMFMGIFALGQHMLTSVIEEKSSRVIEVLLSALSPFELMAGKILGLVGVSLTVIAIWSVAAYAAASSQGLKIEVTVGLLVYFTIYYILGFLLFSSILAGLGSVCNTLKETQSLMAPITLVFVIPMIAWFNLVRNPDGTFARTLSFVPLLTPMVMVVRISAGSDVNLIEILATIVLLAATVLGMMWAAAKVFRIGILMYGKRPRVREIMRWLRQS